MEIRIGVQNVSREVVIETNLTTADIDKKLADALNGFFGSTSVPENESWEMDL